MCIALKRKACTKSDPTPASEKKRGTCTAEDQCSCVIATGTKVTCTAQALVNTSTAEAPCSCVIATSTNVTCTAQALVKHMYG
jgi:hypothetical protein